MQPSNEKTKLIINLMSEDELTDYQKSLSDKQVSIVFAKGRSAKEVLGSLDKDARYDEIFIDSHGMIVDSTLVLTSEYISIFDTLRMITNNLNEGGTIFIGVCYSQWLVDHLIKNPKDRSLLKGKNVVCVGDDGNGAQNFQVLEEKVEHIFEELLENPDAKIGYLSMKYGVTIKELKIDKNLQYHLASVHALHKYPNILEHLLYYKAKLSLLEKKNISGANQDEIDIKLNYVDKKMSEIGRILDRRQKEKTFFGSSKYPGFAREWQMAKELISNKSEKLDFLNYAVSNSFWESLFLNKTNRAKKLFGIYKDQEILDIFGVNFQNSDGRTFIAHAALFQNFEFVRDLIEMGADINAQDCKGCTALMFAVAQSSDAKVVEILIANNADINIKDIQSCSALYHAITYRNHRAVEFLLDKNATFDLSEEKDKIAFVSVVLDNNPTSKKIVEMIIKHTEQKDLVLSILEERAKLTRSQGTQKYLKELINQVTENDNHPKSSTSVRMACPQFFTGMLASRL